jgi:hypothetical protein
MEILPLSWYARVISCTGATPDLVLPAGSASSCNTPSHTSVNIKTSISGQCQNPSKLPNQCWDVAVSKGSFSSASTPGGSGDVHTSDGICTLSSTAFTTTSIPFICSFHYQFIITNPVILKEQYIYTRPSVFPISHWSSICSLRLSTVRI